MIRVAPQMIKKRYQRMVYHFHVNIGPNISLNPADFFISARCSHREGVFSRGLQSSGVPIVDRFVTWEAEMSRIR